MKKIITFEDYKKIYFKYKKCDHGHVIFKDGKEMEFGFIFPTFEEIKNKTLFEYIEEYVNNYFKINKDIQSVSLNR